MYSQRRPTHVHWKLFPRIDDLLGGNHLAPINSDSPVSSLFLLLLCAMSLTASSVCLLLSSLRCCAMQGPEPCHQSPPHLRSIRPRSGLLDATCPCVLVRVDAELGRALVGAGSLD